MKGSRVTPNTAGMESTAKTRSVLSRSTRTRNRGVAMSFATVVLWVGVLLITQLTPVMLEKLGGAKTFLLFMVNAVILLVFTWKKIPETRQRTLEDIEKSWTKE